MCRIQVQVVMSPQSQIRLGEAKRVTGGASPGGSNHRTRRVGRGGKGRGPNPRPAWEQSRHRRRQRGEWGRLEAPHGPWALSPGDGKQEGSRTWVPFAGHSAAHRERTGVWRPPEGDSRGTMKGAGEAAAGLEVGEGRWRWFQESEAWGEVTAGMGTEGREAWGGQQG